MRAAERRERAVEHAGIVAAEQLVQREQCGKLLARQPQARQLEALAFVGRVGKRAVLAIAVDRCAERIAQKRDIAIRGRARARELVHQAASGTG